MIKELWLFTVIISPKDSAMKHTLILIAVLAVQTHAAILTEKEKKMVENFYRECIRETRVDAETTKKPLNATGQETAVDAQTTKKPLNVSGQETGVDAETTKKSLNANQTNLVDEALQHYVECLYKNKQVVTADGHLHKDMLKQYLSSHITDKAKVDELVEKCAKEKTSALETAAEMLECIENNEPPSHQ